MSAAAGRLDDDDQSPTGNPDPAQPVAQLRLKDGWWRLASFQYPMITLIWMLAFAVAGAGAVYTGIVFGHPSAAAGLPVGPSWKLLVADAIYLVVMASGTRFLLRGLAIVGREIELAGQATREIEKVRRLGSDIDASILENDVQFIWSGSGKIEGFESSALYSLCDMLRKSAKEGRFDPIGLTIDRVAEQVFGGSFGIRDAQQLGVRLGILFTFVGIILSLSNVNELMNSATLSEDQTREAIRAIVAALGLAFLSSVSGLTAAIMLQLLGSTLRAKEIALIESFQQIATVIQGIYARAAVKTDEQELVRTLEAHRTEIFSLDRSIAETSGRLANGLKDMGGLIQEPIDALRRQSETLASALGAQQQAMAAVADLSDRLVGLQVQAMAQQEASARNFAVAVTALTDRLVGEVRSGFGAEAQRNLGQQIDRVASRQEMGLLRLYRTLIFGVIFAGFGVVSAVSVIAAFYASDVFHLFGG